VIVPSLLKFLLSVRLSCRITIRIGLLLEYEIYEYVSWACENFNVEEKRCTDSDVGF
jgi:hypothetical protein